MAIGTHTPAGPELIHELIRNLSGAEEPKKLLERILSAAVKMTGATTGSIVLIDKATSSLSIEVASGFADRIAKTTRLKIGKGITGWVAAHAKTLRVDDVRKDSRYVSLRKNIRSELAAPLILNKEVIGLINVDSTRVAAFTPEDEAALETLATLSARVVADALIHDRLRKTSRQFETLVRIGSELTSTTSPERILNDVTAAAAELIHARLVAVRLLDPEKKHLFIAAVHGGSKAYLRQAPITAKDSALGGVALTQIPLIIENISRGGTTFKYKAVARKEGLASMLAVPLVTQGRSLGVLAIYRDKPGDFEDDAVAIAVGLSGLAAAALENARLFQTVFDAERRTRQIEMRQRASEMSAELAHEIRNPLTTVRLLVEAGGTQKDSVFTAPDRRMALRELDRVDGLIKRLLGNASREQPRYEEVDLNALLDEIVMVSQVKAGAKNVTIRKSAGYGAGSGQRGVTVRGDRAELWQAISNIVENAVQAAAKKVFLHIALTSQMRGDDEQDAAVVLIEDDGPGVKNNLPVFDPLVTTKDGGIGIGLFA
ncbi:MAG: GAF domain-containing protein, partial [Candidatus Hydrogenedentota bacterium]